MPRKHALAHETHKMPTVKWFLCLYQAVDLQCSADDKLKGRTLQELERDVEEASARLAMAHKEIRRLTDELESAHLTQKAYGKSLHWSHTWDKTVGNTHEQTEIKTMLLS